MSHNISIYIYIHIMSHNIIYVLIYIYTYFITNENLVVCFKELLIFNPICLKIIPIDY